jgi:hypothetical protein
LKKEDRKDEVTKVNEEELPSPYTFLLRRHHHHPYYLLLITSLLLVYLCHFVLSILFLQISSSIPVSLLPHHYPPHYLHPFPEERSNEEEVIRRMMMTTEEKSIRGR